MNLMEFFRSLIGGGGGAFNPNSTQTALGDFFNRLFPSGTSARELFSSNAQDSFANAVVGEQKPNLTAEAISPNPPLRDTTFSKGLAADAAGRSSLTDFFGHLLPTDQSRVIRYAPGQNTGVGLNPQIASAPRGPIYTRYVSPPGTMNSYAGTM